MNAARFEISCDADVANTTEMIPILSQDNWYFWLFLNHFWYQKPMANPDTEISNLEVLLILTIGWPSLHAL